MNKTMLRFRVWNNINLDILMKIHNNSLQDLRDQLRIIEELAGDKLK